MNNKVHVKTGDTVIVISGRDRGKKGKMCIRDSHNILVCFLGTWMFVALLLIFLPEYKSTY